TNNPFHPARLPHHKAGGNVVFPGAGYVDTLIAANHEVAKSHACVLRDINFLRALIVDNAEFPSLRTIIEDESNIRLYSGTPSKWDDWQLHASARLESGSFNAPGSNPLDAIDENEFDKADVEALYHEFAEIGLEYSGAFQSIKALCKRDNTAIVDLAVESDEGHHLHPALLDGAFQSMLALLADEDSETAFLPVHIDELRLYGEEPITSARAILTITEKNKRSIHANLSLITDGQVVAEVRGIRCDAAALSANAEAAEVETMTYLPTWHEVGLDADLELVENVALVGERDEELADILLELGCGNVDFYDTLANLAADQQVGSYAKIVCLIKTDSEQQALEQSVETVTALQALSAADCSAQVIMVTTEALAADVHGPLPGWHAGWVAGLRRNAHNELDTMSFRQVDKCADTDEVDLATEILSPTAPDEAALRGGDRFGMEFLPLDSNNYRDVVTDRTAPFVDKGDNSFELIHQGRTNFDALTWLEIDRPQPAAREVQVRVESLALNFKDTAKVMGILTEEMMSNTAAGMRLGHECSGIVTALGSDVSEYAIGDRVVVSKEDCFRRYICANVERGEKSVDFLRPVPENITLPEASAATVVYGTALWGLRDHARLRAGDSILIHGAAGGAGMAAMFLAKHYGATTIVTAGTQEKRDFLKAQGADHVLDSRSLNFAAEVREITGGEGVNVVFNSVGGGVVPLSFEALADFGHFIEIGKTDIFTGNRLDMKPFNRSISYSALDLDFLTHRRRTDAEAILDDAWKLIANGDVPALPVTDFSADDVSDAFAYLTRSQQIGKVTINLEGQPQVSTVHTRETGLTPEKTVLITGGFGGVGLLVANWCIDNGAKHLALLGRSGDKSDSAKATVAALEARGVKISAFACDAADRDSLAEVIKTLEAQGPLGSIIHAAGTLDDKPFFEMDEEAVLKVAAPKIKGAANLHELTAENTDIEFFLVFSSIATMTGNTRQANYCLANSYMDSLVQHRLASGLPGNSINLGPVAEAGMAAGNDDTARYLELMGLFMTKGNQMQMLFDRIHRWNLAQVATVNVDWAIWEYAEPRAAASFRFEQVVEKFGASNSNDSVIAGLRRMNGPEREATVAGILVEHISDILQMSADDISLESGLDSFGIDSLTAVELQSMINRSLSIEISILSMLGGKTLQEVAAELVSLMKLDEEPAAPTAVADGDSNVKADLELDATSANEGDLDIPQVS
ncbi:MAG: SDR family NAD(P)-dependent oxidoreductase, partial [Granulosicoccaceae bacterium]